MGKYDPGMESRVWKRVAQGSQPQREDLRGLLVLALEAAGDYRFLSARLTGTLGEQAKKLHGGAQETVSCLRGLQRLRGIELRKQQPLPQAQAAVRRVLERSYHRARNMAGEYMARSADPECGTVFLRLAQREQEACVRLAALLGTVEGRL